MSRTDESRPGQLVAFEGIDGCGKTTVVETVSRRLNERVLRHILIREPGGTRLGEYLRVALLDPSFKGLNPWAEMLLYSASRAQQVHEVIRPALDKGLWVLADRFVDATLAYQGFGRHLGVERIRALHDWSTHALWPDLTILLDCPIDVARLRRSERGVPVDRLEGQAMDFHHKVRAGYLQLASEEPERFRVVDADRSVDVIVSEIEAELQRRIQD